MSEEIKKTEETPETPEVHTESPVVPPVPEDVKPEEKEATAEEVKTAAIDEMEEASRKALDAMREDKNVKNEDVVDEAQEDLNKAFNNFRKAVTEEMDPDKVKEDMKNFRDKVAQILNATKEKVVEVSNSEDFKKTVSAGHDFLAGTANLIGEGLKYGYDNLKKVPGFDQVTDAVDKGFDKLRSSEILKGAVNGAEKGLNDFNSFVFKNLNNFFNGSDKNDGSEE